MIFIEIMYVNITNYLLVLLFIKIHDLNYHFGKQLGTGSYPLMIHPAVCKRATAG